MHLHLLPLNRENMHSHHKLCVDTKKSDLQLA